MSIELWDKGDLGVPYGMLSILEDIFVEEAKKDEQAIETCHQLYLQYYPKPGH